MSFKNSYIYNPPFGGDEFEFYESNYLQGSTVPYGDIEETTEGKHQHKNAAFSFTFTQSQT